MGKHSRQGLMTAKEEQALAYYIQSQDTVRQADLMRRFKRDRKTLLEVVQRLNLLDELRAKMKEAASTRL